MTWGDGGDLGRLRMPGSARCDVVPGDEEHCESPGTVHHFPTPPSPPDRAAAKKRDCNRMVKEALDMSRTIGYCATHRDTAGARACAPAYIRHVQAMSVRCGEPFRGLHYDYYGQLMGDGALDVYDGSGAPIADRSRKIATELVQRKLPWDQKTLRGQLTWSDWFVNRLGRGPRW